MNKQLMDLGNVNEGQLCGPASRWLISLDWASDAGRPSQGGSRVTLLSGGNRLHQG